MKNKLEKLKKARKCKSIYRKIRIHAANVSLFIKPISFKVNKSKRLDPKRSLAVFTKSKVSRDGHRAYAKFTQVVASEHSMKKISDEFRNAAEYEKAGDFIKLKDLIKTIRWRLSRIPEAETKRLLVMGDKGLSMS